MERVSPKHVVRSIKTMNLHLVDIEDCINDSWPALEPSHSVPSGLTFFLPSQVAKHRNDYVHFFIEDYRFERIWNNPERYVSLFKKYAGMIMPDFSTYTNMPIPMQIWNAYRNKALAAYYQSEGIDVIPSLMWSDERSFDWVFDGMPIGGTFAVGTTGFDATPESKHGFYTGLFEAVRCLKPNTLLVYGRKLNLHLPCKMVYYANNSISRLRAVDGRLPPEGRPDHETAQQRVDRVTGDIMDRIVGYQDSPRLMEEDGETASLFGLGDIYEEGD